MVLAVAVRLDALEPGDAQPQVVADRHLHPRLGDGHAHSSSLLLITRSFGWGIVGPSSAITSALITRSSAASAVISSYRPWLGSKVVWKWMPEVPCRFFSMLNAVATSCGLLRMVSTT